MNARPPLRAVLLLLGLGGLAGCATPWNRADWMPESVGKIPLGAVAGGAEADGEPLYVCRADFKGGIYPGKVRSEFKACNIGYRGAELPAIEYEVLVGSGFRWLPATAGAVPAAALEAGIGGSPQRPPFYICRADYNGGVHPGRIAPDGNGCTITWGGYEERRNKYQVLAGPK